MNVLALLILFVISPLINENGVLFVRGTIEGSTPMLFVFDPGAADFLTTAAKSSMHGNEVLLRVGDASIRERLDVLPGDPQQLVPRHDASLGVIGGSVGPGFLRRYAVRVDYSRSTIAFVALDHFVAPRDAVVLPITLDHEGLPAVHGSADSVSGSFELDLRAPTSMLFTQFIQKYGFSARYAGKPVVKQSGVGSQYSLETLGIGPLAVRNVPTWFSKATEGKFFGGDTDGLIGNDALDHFVVTLDYHSMKAYFEHP
jgi:hypothetical protein